MKKLVGLMCVVVVLAACKSGDDDDSSTMMASGTGGTGTGGAMAGTGGMMGVSGMGGGSGLTGACADADISAGGPALHAAALQVLNPGAPCGFMSCHLPPNGKAMLVLKGVTDLKATLVDKPSCEAPQLPLISSMGGEAGLDHSWMWQKLTATCDSTGAITANPAWGAMGACGQEGNQPYGGRMPLTYSDMMLDATRLAAIKAWICAGAPGPQ
jgi:hypothetical protein